MAKLKHLTRVVLIVFILFLIHLANTKNKEIEQLNLLINKEEYKVEQSQKLLAEIQKEVSKQENEIKELKQEYRVIKQKRFLTADDIEVLERIVEAEARSEGLEGKQAVASVILNRLIERNRKSIRDVVFRKGQFSPVSNGMYYKAKVSNETKKAVEMALIKDYSKGASYFYNPRISSRSGIRFFNTLTPTTSVGNHVFAR